MLAWISVAVILKLLSVPANFPTSAEKVELSIPYVHARVLEVN